MKHEPKRPRSLCTHPVPPARRLLVVATILSAAVACRSTSIGRQAEKIAKNWSFVIRANQVLPVYPLTEDLQPGDVFLVDIPINEQQEIYAKKGYLPLDHHLTRLPLEKKSFEDFYAGRFFKGDYKSVPHGRPRPEAGGPSGESRSAGVAPPEPEAAEVAPPSREESEDEEAEAETDTETEEHRFRRAPAPMAAFPSYSFSVDRSGGLDIGLPIQGIPIAVGLMGADKAEVSVTISDALTYGLGTMQVLESLRAWAEDPLVKAELEFLHEQNVRERAGAPPSLFLRVVNRVYLTGGVTVTVNRASALGGDVQGGAERDVGAPLLGGMGEATTMQQQVSALTTTLNQALPGGRIRFGLASRQSISLAEEFDRPLAVGYLGFDVPLYANGQLGAPVATAAVLLRGVSPPTTMGELSPDQLQYDLRRIWLGQAAAGRDPDVSAQMAKGAVVRAAKTIPDDRFESIVPELEAAEPAGAVEKFFNAADRYVSQGGDQGVRYKRLIASIDAAVEAEQDEEGESDG